MKLGNLLAVVACMGIGTVVTIGAPGCTASLTVGTCDASNCGFPTTDDGGGNNNGPDAVSPTPTPDAGQGAFNACNSCMYGQCVGAYNNCVQNADCVTAYQCAAAPSCASNPSCVQACYSSSTPLGQRLYAALSVCDFISECPGVVTGATAACATTCAGTVDCSLPDAGSGDDGGTTPDSGDDGGTTTDAAPPPEDASTTVDATAEQTCDQCQTTNCASQLAACANGQPCAIYNQCVLSCQNASCVSACQTANSAGFTAAVALGTCTANSCSKACQ